MIVGGTPGIILSNLANLLIPALVLYIFGGVVAGGVLGAIIGSKIKKRVQNK